MTVLSSLDLIVESRRRRGRKYRVVVGLLLLIVPWTGLLGQNYFADGWPLVRTVVASGFVKGAISGLGLVNLGAAVAEMVALVRKRSDAADEASATDRPADGRA